MSKKEQGKIYQIALKIVSIKNQLETDVVQNFLRVSYFD
jgi:hypothetical protein